jgi:hypothetical protein
LSDSAHMCDGEVGVCTWGAERASSFLGPARSRPAEDPNIGIHCERSSHMLHVTLEKARWRASHVISARVLLRCYVLHCVRASHVISARVLLRCYVVHCVRARSSCACSRTHGETLFRPSLPLKLFATKSRLSSLNHGEHTVHSRSLTCTKRTNQTHTTKSGQSVSQTNVQIAQAPESGRDESLPSRPTAVWGDRRSKAGACRPARSFVRCVYICVACPGRAHAWPLVVRVCW